MKQKVFEKSNFNNKSLEVKRNWYSFILIDLIIFKVMFLTCTISSIYLEAQRCQNTPCWETAWKSQKTKNTMSLQRLF